MKYINIFWVLDSLHLQNVYAASRLVIFKYFKIFYRSKPFIDFLNTDPPEPLVWFRSGSGLDLVPGLTTLQKNYIYSKVVLKRDIL